MTRFQQAIYRNQAHTFIVMIVTIARVFWTPVGEYLTSPGYSQHESTVKTKTPRVGVQHGSSNDNSTNNIWWLPKMGESPIAGWLKKWNIPSFEMDSIFLGVARHDATETTKELRQMRGVPCLASKGTTKALVGEWSTVVSLFTSLFLHSPRARDSDPPNFFGVNTETVVYSL